MSTKEVSAFITKLLCRSRGCMEYSELHRAVRQRYSLSDQDLLAFLGETSRFIVTGDSSQSGVAGPQPGAASRVIAKTSVRLCQMQECDGRFCQNLHLCKYLVCGQCGRGKKCKYSHKVHSSHNSNILTEEGLQDLDQLELFQLLLQNDNWLLPDICSHYNLGSDKHGSCTYKKKCFKLHICKFFLQGDCIFANNCRRAHRFDESSIMILEKRCFKVDLNSQRVLYEIYKNRFMITADFEKAAESWRSESSSSAMKVIEPNSSDICFYYILGQCGYKEKCRNVHYDLPYRWQILNSDGVSWNDHPDMEDVERAYSKPENDVSEGLPPVDFQTMKCGSAEVRRLSTQSSVTKHSSHFLTTEWLWYWKDSEGQWRQYGCEREEKYEASSQSHTLEKSYLGDINGRMRISIGRKEFIINFKDMCQQNHDNQAKVEVRRRPRFISASEVERKRSRYSVFVCLPEILTDFSISNKYFQCNTCSRRQDLIPHPWR
ncbi:protein mono-ADP-ribosyltransferase PARP12-like isoform X1 [Paramormyrops kingsleyae]|uniref:protein mono-ADP-ribosyltransferase PARP12-like isoform X1 n=1 Tax=Paramormyrops kingsleyae TaxID=1676925 RepID=UPI003B9777CF